MFKHLVVIAALLVSSVCFAEEAKSNKLITSVHFDTDKSAIRENEVEKLQLAAESIKANKLIVAVIGNADKRAGRLYNLALAERRANAVKAALVSAGAPEDQIVVEVSQGEEKPLAPNDNLPEHLQANRRVDVILVRPLIQTRTETVPVVKELVRRHRVAVLGGLAPSGVNKAKLVAPNTFVVKEDFDLEAGLSYSFLTPLFNNRLSVTGAGFTNKSGFIGIGLDF